MTKSTTSDSRTSTSKPARGDIFATTHWTVVLAAGRQSNLEGDRALEELCRVYWYPLYAYVRRQGYSREDAEDLIQGFFARFLQRNYLEQLSSEKGRFRAFLLASVKHYLSNERDRTTRRKRGGGEKILSIDWQDAETRYGIEPVDRLSPDTLYDRAWGTLLLEQVIARLRDESAAEGKEARFEILKPFLMAAKGDIRYADVAEQLGLSEGAARVLTHRLRRRYRQVLREQIAQTLREPGMIEAELQALFAAFSA